MPFDDLQLDRDDDKLTPRMRRRLLRAEALRLIAELLGAFLMRATAMIDGDLFRGDDGCPVLFAIWAPLKKVAVDRLPRGISVDDPAARRRADLLAAKGVTYLPFQHGETISPRAIASRLGLDIPGA